MTKSYKTADNGRLVSFFFIVLLATATFIIAGTLFIIYSASIRMDSLRRLEERVSFCNSAVSTFMRGSDYLTSEAWQYAIDEDPAHMTNYWNEVEKNRSRDKAVEALYKTGLTPEETKHVRQAKANSDHLILGETWCMRVIAERNGIKEADMPARVRACKLSKKVEALSPEDKIQTARMYVFGPAYEKEKQSIRLMVQACRADIIKRMEANTYQSINAGIAITKYAVVSVIALLAVMLGMVFTFGSVMKKKNFQLLTALEHAEDASRSKSYFTSRMSHEMRTPLNAVLGYLNIARKTDDAAKKDDSINKSRIAAETLLHIVNDVLDLSAIESGRIKIDSGSFGISQLIDELLVIYAAQAKEKNIELTVVNDIASNWLKGDRMKTGQMLTNLLSNALKFTPEGGRIQLKAEQAGEPSDDGLVNIRYSVSDTGIGMSADFVPHVFEAYEQEDTTINIKYGGTGLGLSIVKNMAEAMGGSVSAESIKGKGTTFILTLPYTISDKEAAEADSAETRKKDGCETAAGQSLNGMHLLLAEDNQMNSEIAQTVLTDAGADVTLACNGQKAAEIFESSAKGTFTAILMDIMMPVMDGYTATKHIRASAHPEAKDIPIIAMTANAFEDDIEKARKAGMNAHIAKPLNVPHMIEVIRETIDKRGR